MFMQYFPKRNPTSSELLWEDTAPGFQSRMHFHPHTIIQRRQALIHNRLVYAFLFMSSIYLYNDVSG